MYTVLDYIKYYRNVSLKQTKWNAIDNLICSLLCYLPLREFNEKVSINELHTKLLRSPKAYEAFFVKKTLEIFELVENSIRYKDMYVLNCVNKKNKSTQFGAVTFKIGKIKVISFKGTDSSHIGWLENFRLIYEYPTNTHKLAIDYLNKNIGFIDFSDVYVVGHSKGGNLAMVSAMEMPKFKFNKIKKVYNFDGPGFRKNDFDSEKFTKLSSKLVNIVPSGSIVGVLMYNKEYEVVKSNTVVGLDHFPTSWNIFGEFFVEDKLSMVGQKLNHKTTVELEKIDPKLFKDFIEELFNKLTSEKIDDIQFSFRTMKNVYDNMKNVDPKIKKYLDDILRFLIMPTGRAVITKRNM